MGELFRVYFLFFLYRLRYYIYVSLPPHCTPYLPSHVLSPLLFVSIGTTPYFKIASLIGKIFTNIFISMSSPF